MLLSGAAGSVQVPGKNLTVSVRLSLSRKDLSGDSAGTDYAAGGTKPHQLAVAFLLPFEEAGKLTALADAAKAVNDMGDPEEWDIQDDVADLMKVRSVIFDGDLSVKKHDSLLAYEVSFNLSEVDSVAEQAEKNRMAEKNGEAAAISTDPEDINSYIEAQF